MRILVTLLYWYLWFDTLKQFPVDKSSSPIEVWACMASLGIGLALIGLCCISNSQEDKS